MSESDEPCCCPNCGLSTCDDVTRKMTILVKAKGLDSKSISLVLACLEKAQDFEDKREHVQALRYADFALTKLKQLKNRPLSVIEIISDALRMKYNALNLLHRRKEALECATERYSLWSKNYMRNVGMIHSSIPLIESLINNKAFDQAQLIAGTVYEMTNHPTTNNIPEDDQQPLLANAAHYFSSATLKLAQAGGIPPEEKQKTGKEAIMLLHKAMEIHAQLHGAESVNVAQDIGTLAHVLAYFNNIDDEVLRLTKQAIAIYRRKEGNLSQNVAIGEYNLANEYYSLAMKAVREGDQNGIVVNLELSLPHYLEAMRIYRAINDVDEVEKIEKEIVDIKKLIYQPFFEEMVHDVFALRIIMGLIKVVVKVWNFLPNQLVPAHLFNPPLERPHTLAMVLAIVYILRITLPYSVALLQPR